MGTVTTPVILSGGSGTRLWPLSLPGRPKQLQALVTEESMIQATVRRAAVHSDSTPPVVVCNERQVAEVADQLSDIGHPPRAVVVEPAARNTAPAVTAAAMLVDPESVIAVLPADHLIEDGDVFQAAMAAAVQAAVEGHLVVFGVPPTRPETGFGYIEVGDQDGSTARLERFVEKPDPATAVELVASGHLWNSGMFAFTAGGILAEMRRWEPRVVEAVGDSVRNARSDQGVVRLGDAFREAPSISIDYAVMERTDHGRVVPLDAGWSDVGSWQSLWEALAPDGRTVTVGDVHTVDVQRSYVRSESRPVAVIGVDDVVVVETPEAVLVVDRGRAQEVRSAADWFAHLRRD